MTDREELGRLASELKFAADNTQGCLYSQRKMLNDASSALRRLAEAGTQPPAPSVAVKVKALVWRDHRPDSFPEPAWSAETPFGFYHIEEVSASDSPAYVVRLHAHHFIADKYSLEEAKAAAQSDYEQRILSALESPAAGDGEPVATNAQPFGYYFWTGNGDGTESPDFCEGSIPSWKRGVRNVTPLFTAPPADAGMREALERSIHELEYNRVNNYSPDITTINRLKDQVLAALTAPGATTKSDGGDLDARFNRLEKEATDLGYVLTPEPEHPDSPHNGPSDLYLSRDAVRQILIEQPDENLDITEGVLAEIDALPIFTQADICAPSDPSSTRSEVTVESLAETLCRACGDYWWQSSIHNSDNRRWIERATKMLDQFEIRRKK